MSDNERFYDEEIAPELARLAKKCVDRGLPFLAVVQYGPEDIGRTQWLGTEFSMAMRILATAADTRNNVDSLVISLARQCRENGIPHTSIFLNRLLEPDPADRAGGAG